MEVWSITKQAFSDFIEDDAMSLAGALAFYTALSLAPLLVILLSVASTLGPSTQDSIVQQIDKAVGPEAAEGIHMIIESSKEKASLGSIAGIISFAILLFSASGVFAQLQYSLNKIWDVQAKPSAGVWQWIRKRLLSFGMILAIAFLLMVSLVLSTAIGALSPSGEGPLWQLVSLGIAFVVFWLLFAAMYKYLPDVTIRWRDVLTGALITSLLFMIGKYLIGLYLAHSSAASSYGAAGSFLILLLWVYYSALLVFLGAEITQSIAHMRGSPIEPDEHAQWIPGTEHPGTAAG